jgi:phosphomannomutase
MRQLASLMRWFQADLGAAINVDGDRVGFVTASAVALSEEYALPLAAEMRLRRRPGTVVTSMSSSRMIDAVAERHGQRVIRTLVGESHVIDHGLAEGAVLAGEGSGGVAALPVSMTFDGLLTLGLVLEYMAVTGESLEALAGLLPRLVIRKHELACPPNLVYRILDRFRVLYRDLDPECEDGVRVVWKDAWLHVRASNTEPMLRIITESESSHRAEALLEEAVTFARRATYGQGGI